MLEKEDLKQIEIIINSALENKFDPLFQRLGDINTELKLVSYKLKIIVNKRQKA